MELINKGLSEDQQSRLKVLNSARKSLKLTEAMQLELIKLVELAEQLDADRIIALSELSIMRGITVNELIKQLKLFQSKIEH